MIWLKKDIQDSLLLFLLMKASIGGISRQEIRKLPRSEGDAEETRTEKVTCGFLRAYGHNG